MEQNAYMYEVIFGDLKGKIERGELKAGYRLPTEKELGEQYRVSRITSKKAMDMLADLGMIYRVRGRGSYVSEKKEWNVESAPARMAEREMPSVYPEVPAKEETVKRKRVIGVILDDFNEDFGAVLLKSILKEAEEKGYEVIVRCTYGDQKAENDAIEGLLLAGASGLLLVSVQNETYNASILKLVLDRYPVVLIDRKMAGIPISCVNTDNYTAAKDLTRILIERGNHKVGILTHSWVQTPTIRDRYQGFADCIMEYEQVNGMKCMLESYHTTPVSSLNFESMYRHCSEEMKQIILNNQECTGYLATESRLAWILSRALQELDLKKDIVYFDFFSLGRIQGSIACVKQGEEAMGKRAVQVLDQVIEGAKVSGDIFIPYQIYKE